MSEHRWKFYRSGGVDQVVLRDAEDLKKLRQLDQKLWLALACPAKGLEIDARMLEMLDTDRDGRIRPPEILAAIDWLSEVLKSLDELEKPASPLLLAAIRDDTPAGRALRAAGQRFVGKDVFTLEDLSAAAAVKQASDAACSKTIEDELVAAWEKQGADPSIRVLGDATSAAADVLAACEAKIDDWFMRCRLAAFDPRAQAALSAAESELVALSAKSLNAGAEEIARLPLAGVGAGR